MWPWSQDRIKGCGCNLLLRPQKDIRLFCLDCIIHMKEFIGFSKACLPDPQLHKRVSKNLKGTVPWHLSSKSKIRRGLSQKHVWLWFCPMGLIPMNSHRTHQWNHHQLGSKWTVHSNFLQSWSRPRKTLRLRLGPFLMEKKWWPKKYSQDPLATAPRKQNRALTYIFPFPKTGEAGDIHLAEYQNFNGLVKAKFLLFPPFLNKSIYCSHPVLVSSSWLEYVWNIQLVFLVQESITEWHHLSSWTQGPDSDDENLSPEFEIFQECLEEFTAFAFVRNINNLWSKDGLWLKMATNSLSLLL